VGTASFECGVCALKLLGGDRGLTEGSRSAARE
jgi:hypothetical protein